MIDETLTIEHLKSQFAEWIIAYDPSRRCYWILNWRYPIGWREVKSMLAIESEIRGIETIYPRYVGSWERDSHGLLRGSQGVG
ncbi:hypothetical protein GCM10023196_053570 [Actinoallomurus vinaceus]|uniref:Uncharacterized protein n=1 Tax=Actinoallomurus vinaceus TaxID=1080074 RepID=A0ABP8UHJ3_9ACTN